MNRYSIRHEVGIKATPHGPAGKRPGPGGTQRRGSQPRLIPVAIESVSGGLSCWRGVLHLSLKRLK